MINMEQKFKQDPKFHEMYAATINDYIKQGHAIKVTSEKSSSHLKAHQVSSTTYHTMV